MSSFRNLVVWQKAMDLVDEIYLVVREFPKSEVFVLSAQMRSAAISIPSNIAEGQGRWTMPDYRKFLREARGSLLELETQILIAKRQNFIDVGAERHLIARVEEVGRLINGLLRYVNRRSATRDRRPAT